MKKILLLINPFSGTHSLDLINAKVAAVREKTADTEIVTHVIRDFDDSHRLTRQAVDEGYYAVVIVGGDGTANSTGALLKGSDTALGIVPAGSGNGVGRHIGMDIDLEKALSQVFTCHPVAVDTMEVNGRFCLGFAGTGFEAAVAHNFARSKHRGLVSYTTSALSEILRYDPPAVEVDIDGQTIKRTPFTMTFANSSQWGFDFRIAPAASMTSGKMKLVILSDISQINAVQAAYSLYKGKIHTFPSCETVDAAHVTVSGKKLVYHIDGEPFPATDRIEVVVRPASLKLLSPGRKI